jgi:hypothetical protein
MIKCILGVLENNGIIDFLKFIWTNTDIHNISNVLSLINAVFCLWFMYQYSKTKDISLFFKLALYIFIPFLVIDSFITIYLILIKSEKKTCYEIIFHHILSILLIIWALFIGIQIAPDVIYNLMLFEISTIFLNFRFWIKEYIKKREGTANTIPSVIKILDKIIDVLFTVTFIYFRCYALLKNIIFNKEFYNILLVDGLFINKVFICVIFVFILLNFYWSSIIVKSIFKQLQTFIQSKVPEKETEQEQEQDQVLILIEKIHLDIIKNRNTFNQN